MAKVDFGYALGHDILDIQQHSKHYGPLNRYKRGFENTDKAEHVRIFAAINKAVHQQGKGLSDIYYTIDGQSIDKFLHEAEIQHLQDVANLIDTIKPPAMAVSLLWLVLSIVIALRKIATPKLGQQFLAIVIFILVCGLSIVLIGAETVFNAFHQWIFPEDHQWYFFYQESLMSTLMKAPDLFGVIAVFLVVLALVIFLGLINLLRSFIAIKAKLKHRLQ